MGLGLQVDRRILPPASAVPRSYEPARRN